MIVAEPCENLSTTRRRRGLRVLQGSTRIWRRVDVALPGLPCALVSAAAIGCGDGEPAGTACEADVVEGQVVFHSLNRLAAERSGRAIDATGLVAAAVDLDALASGASPEPLAEVGLVGEECAQASTGSCRFSLEICRDADAGNGAPGIAIRDGRSDAPLWLTTAQPLDAKASFAVTRDALDTVVAPLLGRRGEELMRRGVIFGSGLLEQHRHQRPKCPARGRDGDREQ